MNLPDFSTSLKQMSPEDQLMLLSHLNTLLNDPSLFSSIGILEKEPNFQEIIKIIAQVKDDPKGVALSRSDTLERIRKYCSSSVRLHTRNAERVFLPEVQKGNLLLINFTGIGSELTGNHYGIVWEVDRVRDHLLIIPTTSFKPSETVESSIKFNVGRIGHMSDETVVTLDQISPISRKRIVQYEVTNSQGIQRWASISRAQEKRIQEGMRTLFLGEWTLHRYLTLERYRQFLPELPSPAQFAHLHRIVTIQTDLPTGLTYSLPDEPGVIFSVNWRTYRCTPKYRNQLIKNWVNAVETVDSDGRIVTRDQRQQNIYQHLCTFMV